ncbi:MAG: hypothetical protein J5669_08040 [Bacteroidales bacterium]|nr:hypothetical protein [Bacteroidales bacterium]
MKKFLLVMAAVLGMAVVAAAQPRAIGLRVGYGAELSYQHTIGGANFLEADLGWSTGAFSLAAAYDFSIAPLGPLNFYAGPALQLNLISVPEAGIYFCPGVGGQLGLEYTFNFPLQLSIDWRPMLVFNTGAPLLFSYAGLALGIRYAF